MNNSLKYVTLAALALALASCTTSFNIGGGSQSSSESQTTASYSSLTESEKALVAQIQQSNNISTDRLVSIYNSSSNAYVRNEVILQLVARLTNENKYEAAKYYLKNFATSTDARQNSQYNYLATRLGQLTNDQELINNTPNVDLSQISINQKLSAAQVEIVKAFSNSQYDLGLDTANSVFSSLDTADQQTLIDSTLSQLTRIPVTTLSNLTTTASSPTNAAWYSLAQIAVENSNNADELARAYNNWANTYSGTNNPAINTKPSLFKQSQSAAASNYNNVTVLLPLTGTYSPLAEAVRQGINAANKEAGNRVRVSYVDTTTTPATQAVQDADGKADIILGPLLRDDVVAVNQLRLTTPEIMLTSVGSYNIGACYYSMGIEDQASTIANVMNQLNVNNPVIFSDGTSSSVRAASEFARNWLTLKQQNVTVITFNDGDLTQNVKNLLARTPRPDAVLFLGSAEQLVTFNSTLSFEDPDNTIKTFATYRTNDESLTPAKLADLKNTYFTESSVIAEAKSSLGRAASSALDTNNYNAKRLFAFGYDAFKLAQNYSALRSVNNFTVDGATGKIIITPGRNCIVSNYYNVYQVVNGEFVKIN